MSVGLLVALTTLLLFSCSAIAQIETAKCTQSSWNWTFNSMNQNPCKIAGYLLSTCSGGSFTIDPLPSGYKYTGPTSFDGSNLCKCNAIVYSLISACGACQGESWFAWSRYSINCTRPEPPSTFTNAIPAGTRVPQWALIDVTVNGTWDSIESMSVGDDPEIGPGALIGVSSSATDGPTGTSPLSTDFPAVTTPTPSPPTSSSSLSPSSPPSGDGGSNTGAIAGGVVGGIALIAIVVIGTFYMRRQRLKAPPSAAFDIDGSSQLYNGARKAMSDGGTYASSPMPSSPINPMRVHNPNGSNVFPGFQGAQHARDFSAQPPFSRPNGTGNALVNVNPSLSRGYNGLPTV